MSALQRKLAVKTDKQLFYYLQNPEKHTEEAVEIALNELRNRNVEITSNLLEGIKTHKEQSTINKIKESNTWTRNVVQDTDAPALYSQSAHLYLLDSLFRFFWNLSPCRESKRF